MNLPYKLITLALLFCSPAAMAQQAKKPNIIFIIADDLGYGNLTSYNPAHKVPTPNIDRLARKAQSSRAFMRATRYVRPAAAH
ncbi:sulfatase-like hydrolase/transferase [Chitinophaga sedimenti]|uniref:sulfatase-like hydrolase/transferase n=1 Tax=Chitinophaga sedimenti TaxID=2033606 RepID=UPI0020042F6A|nr:sulfatase-like hydrolase/transferase [Chitinophaga sedimenti]MCK7553581.1 sulfatase-like hydrolase/transferase [Chitinophaga sedimenti]